MSEEKIVWRSSFLKIRVIAVSVLVMCIGVFGFVWYGLHLEYVRNHRAWFDFQEQKLIDFSQIGMQQYEALPEQPGRDRVAEYMKSSFDPDISSRYVEINSIVDKDASSFPNHGKVSLYVDEDGDQILAYGNAGILGFKYPVFFQKVDASLKYTFPYMKELSGSNIGLACVDPDESKHEAFADVAERLFQSEDVWAEKDGYTFKKSSVSFWNGNTEDVIFSRKNPGAFHTYGNQLLIVGLCCLGAAAAALLIGWIWLTFLKKRALKIEDAPVVDDERAIQHRKNADGLYALVEAAINSLGPKPEFDRISQAIDEVKAETPRPEVRKEVEGISEKGRKFLRVREFLVEAVILILVGSLITGSASFMRRRAYEQSLDSKIQDVPSEARSVEAQGEADLEELAEKLDNTQLNVAQYLILSYSSLYSNSMKWISEEQHLVLDSQTASVKAEDDLLSEEQDSLPENAIEDNYEIVFKSQDFILKSLSDPDHQVVLASMSTGEDGNVLHAIVFSDSRPDESAEEVKFFLPCYFDREYRIFVFYNGIIYFNRKVMFGQRFYQTDEAGDKQYSNIKADHIHERLPQEIPDTYNYDIDRDVKWIKITQQILDANKTSGWADGIWYHSFIENSDDRTTGRETVLFIPGYTEWESWTQSTVKTALVAVAWILIVLLSLKLLEIRSDRKEKTFSSENEEESSTTQNETWAPILKQIDEAEKELGTIGYLEDLRKKIAEFK